jgi:hypothetical protein
MEFIISIIAISILISIISAAFAFVPCEIEKGDINKFLNLGKAMEENEHSLKKRGRVAGGSIYLLNKDSK